MSRISWMFSSEAYVQEFKRNHRSFFHTTYFQALSHELLPFLRNNSKGIIYTIYHEEAPFTHIFLFIPFVPMFATEKVYTGYSIDTCTEFK